MKVYGQTEVQFHAFLSSVVDEREWLTSGYCYVMARAGATSSYWTGSSVCQKVDPDVVTTKITSSLPGLGDQSSGE
jgi:hypothetical protein